VRARGGNAAELERKANAHAERDAAESARAVELEGMLAALQRRASWRVTAGSAAGFRRRRILSGAVPEHAERLCFYLIPKLGK